MIARVGQRVARRRTSGLSAARAAIDLRLDPAVALQLEKLLPHRFAGQRKLGCEPRDRCGAVPFERDQNGAATIGKLIDGDDGDTSLIVATRSGGKKSAAGEGNWLRQQDSNLRPTD